MDPFQLDWGTVTPELVSSELGVALHVFNHTLESDAARERTLRFINARLRWYATQLPEGWKQWVRIDDRGQKLSTKARKQLRSKIEGAEQIELFTEMKR